MLSPRAVLSWLPATQQSAIKAAFRKIRSEAIQATLSYSAHELEMASREAGQSEGDVAARTMCEMMRDGRTRASSVPAAATAAPIQSTTTTMIASSLVS